MTLNLDDDNLEVTPAPEDALEDDLTAAPAEPEIDPARSFALDAWLADAELPEESASVYKKASVIAELTELKRQIENARLGEDGERSSGESSPTAALEAEYERLLNVFADSQLTIYVRAITKDEGNALRQKHEQMIDMKKWTPAYSNARFGYDLLSAAIVAVKPAGGERVPAKFTPKQVKAMEDRIGPAQMPAILAARQKAQNAVPTVDADFLRVPSGMEGIQE